MKKLKRVAAAAMAMAMVIPSTAFAEAADAPTRGSVASGDFETSFGAYSPELNISVPLKLDIEVNPMADTTSVTGVDNYYIASNSIDIWNASTDVDKNRGIPVSVSVRASITGQGEGVVTEYNDFTADLSSMKKKVNLNLAKATTAETIKLKDGATKAFIDGTKKLNLTLFEEDAAAKYEDAAKKVPITKYGSFLCVDIAAPQGDTNDPKFEDATKITPSVGSFAVIGTANAGADWKAEDVKVNVTYDVRASQSRAIATPTLGAAVTATAGNELSIIVPEVGEATVVGVGVHNDNEEYKDYIWDAAAYKVTYAAVSGKMGATIKFDKADEVLKFIDTNFAGEKQDLVIALSDGRIVVSTLTVGTAK